MKSVQAMGNAKQISVFRSHQLWELVLKAVTVNQVNSVILGNVSLQNHVQCHHLDPLHKVLAHLGNFVSLTDAGI